MKTKLAWFVAGLLVSLLSERKCAGAQAPEYTVIDLGTLGGNYSYAYGINDHGQVVGMSQNSFGSKRAFLYSEGSMQDLGTLGNDHSEAYGINDSGQVVGVVWNSDFSVFHAFLYSEGSLRDLGTLGGKYSKALDINSNGQVVGWSRINDGLGSNRGFIFSNGSMRRLGTLGGSNSEAYGINDSGEVVGQSSLSGFGARRAFLYSGGSMKNLGTLADSPRVFYSIESSAFAINNHSQIVGESSIRGSDGLHAFLYSNGSMKDLGTLGGDTSVAYAINNHGQVVGESKIGGGTHAFLYSNGVMRDLNDLIGPASGWELLEAKAINDVGQIVGYGINPSGQFRAFLLNPLTVEAWRKTIETTPTKPTYGEPPKKEDGKDSLIVVTHGWQPAFLPVDIAWVDAMTNAITAYLTANGRTDWQVHAYRWVEGARPSIRYMFQGAKIALDNAKSEGVNLGTYILKREFAYVHIIAHSAGAGLAQATLETIKAKLPNTVVHLTFLDPFVGFDYAGKESYGKGADWAENIFSRDALTSPIAHQFTEGPLDNTHNVDVTLLDPNKVVTDTFRSSPTEALRYCFETRTSHGWPYEFYIRTIPPNTMDGSGDFGFPLSEESGGLGTAMAKYGKRGNIPALLGIPDPPCESTWYVTTPSFIGEKMRFTDTSIVKSATGIIKLEDLGFTLTTDSPVWVARHITITDKANFVLFESRFVNSNGSEGLLSVYWGTNIIGTLDERVALAGGRTNVFVLPKTVTGGIETLGFRLDAFSAVRSSVTITNVALGFSGLDQPFSLSVTGAYESGQPVFQLTGPAGYNYSVEASSNLVDWTPIALLANTSGIVRFSDSHSNNITARFYRAVAP